MANIGGSKETQRFRDQVFKSVGADMRDNFYSLFDKIIKHFQNLATAETGPKFDEDLDKIKQGCKTLIEDFFNVAILQTKDLQQYKDRATGYDSILKRIVKVLGLQHYTKGSPLIKIKPITGPDMLDYIAEFVHEFDPLFDKIGDEKKSVSANGETFNYHAHGLNITQVSPVQSNNSD